MAVTDFASLKSAVLDWADNTNISDERVGEFVQMTTQALNYGSEEISPLRVRQMEEVATLLPTDGVCALPANYLQYRRVCLPSSLRQPLTYITPSKAEEIYPARSAGTPCNFTIVGASLYPLPTTSLDIELTYYQKIPEMVDDDDTNWLLDANYAVYLHGTLLHLAMFTRDADLQNRSAGLLTSLTNGLSGSDQLANFAFAPSYASGMTIA